MTKAFPQLTRTRRDGWSPEADRLTAELRAAGAGVLAVRADVSDPAALLAALDTAVAHFGRLDILVNNAGLAIVGPLQDYAPDAFDRVFKRLFRSS